jgi:hypothetical protein
MTTKAKQDPIFIPHSQGRVSGGLGRIGQLATVHHPLTAAVPAILEVGSILFASAADYTDTPSSAVVTEASRGDTASGRPRVMAAGKEERDAGRGGPVALDHLFVPSFTATLRTGPSRCCSSDGQR